VNNWLFELDVDFQNVNNIIFIMETLALYTLLRWMTFIPYIFLECVKTEENEKAENMTSHE
jgi:hypothetical protein